MSRTVRPYSVLVALLAVCLFAAVGYRIGHTERASGADAASTWGTAAASTFTQARTRTYRAAWQRAYQVGWRSGSVAARRRATAAGDAAGRSEAAIRAAASRTLAAALASAPIRRPKELKTDRCLPIEGGLCEVLGPQVTGRRCPPASVPNLEGGVVCVPRVLLLAVRMAAASGSVQLKP